MAQRIRKINADARATVHLVALQNLPSNAQITGIAVSSNGTIYAADHATSAVYKIYENGTIDGAVAGKLNTPGEAESSEKTSQSPLGGQSARFSAPSGIAADASDNIYITDSGNKVVFKLSPSGRVKIIAGSGSVGDAVNSSNGLLATFSATLGGIAVDKAGNIYVADTGNHKIKKILTDGSVVTLAGGPGGAGASGFVNGQGNTARFSSPTDVAVNDKGVVFVADSGNNRIRRIDESGYVTTLSGNGTSALVDGPGLSASFVSPQKLAIDPSGRFLMVMTSDGAIRRVAESGATSSVLPFNPPSPMGDLTFDKSGFLYILEKAS